MSKKIERMIEKKYSKNKDNDILSEMIDEELGELEEGDPEFYSRKAMVPQLEEQEMSPEDIALYAAGNTADPRNEIPDEPGYGDNVGNIARVTPTKMA